MPQNAASTVTRTFPSLMKCSKMTDVQHTAETTGISSSTVHRILFVWMCMFDLLFYIVFSSVFRFYRQLLVQLMLPCCPAILHTAECMCS